MKITRRKCGRPKYLMWCFHRGRKLLQIFKSETGHFLEIFCANLTSRLCQVMGIWVIMKCRWMSQETCCSCDSCLVCEELIVNYRLREECCLHRSVCYAWEVKKWRLKKEHRLRSQRQTLWGILKQHQNCIFWECLHDMNWRKRICLTKKHPYHHWRGFSSNLMTWDGFAFSSTSRVALFHKHSPTACFVHQNGQHKAPITRRNTHFPVLDFYAFPI